MYVCTFIHTYIRAGAGWGCRRGGRDEHAHSPGIYMYAAVSVCACTHMYSLVYICTYIHSSVYVYMHVYVGEFTFDLCERACFAYVYV